MRQFFNKKHASWWALLYALFTALFWLGFVTPTQAYADTRQDIVSQKSVNIPQGQIAEDVLVLGNNATISGTVTDTLVVLNGNIHLTSSARTGVVIDLGGHLTQESGAHINAVYTLSFDRPVLNSLALGSTLIMAVWAMQLALSASLVALPVMVAAILQTRLDSYVSKIEKSARRAGLAGLLCSVMFLALSGISAITIVALPLTALLLVAYVLLGLVGYTCVSIWLGRMTRIGHAANGSVWLQALIGATFIMAFTNIPLVGPILLLIAWLVGVGTATMQIWQRWQIRLNKTSKE